MHETKESSPQKSPIDSCLAHWGQFFTKCILCCVTSDLLDNVTEIIRGFIGTGLRNYFQLDGGDILWILIYLNDQHVSMD